MPRKRKSNTGNKRKHFRARPYAQPSSSGQSETKTDCDITMVPDASTTKFGRIDAATSTTDLQGKDASTETCDLEGEFFGNFVVLTEFESLRQKLQTSVQHPYSFISMADDDIHIFQLNQCDAKSAVKLKIHINRHFVTKLYVHNKEVSRHHAVWDSVPLLLTREWHVLRLLSNIKKFNVCIGNPDSEYTTLTPVGTTLSDNKTPTDVAYHEGDFCAYQGELSFSSTIRTIKCSLLTDGMRCVHCQQYRRNLRKRRDRIEEIKSSNKDFTKSTFKHSDMPREVLIKKLYQQKAQIKSLAHEVDKLNRDLRTEIKRKGFQANEYETIELTDLMSSCRNEVESAFPDPNSYQRLFWNQQVKYAESGKFGMRWHPMIIRWCLYLRHKSAKAYDALRESGFVKLPSNKTLYDYSHYIKSELGFQADVLLMLMDEADKLGMYNSDTRSKQFVGILFDEVRIKEDLVYDKHTGELVGYCNLDSIGNSMMKLQQILKNTKSTVAKYILVLMVRGITTNLKFPLAGFATTSITADFLYPIIWKAITYLETYVKLKVLFLTCDGGSANRRFYNLHRVNNNERIFFVPNPHDSARNIYFISDVPHLLKTTRNCFSNSFSHKNTRRMWRNGKDISWMHLVRLFEEHCEMDLYTTCPKLTRSHIDLKAFSYMKVNLAAQVMSDTVANALEDLYSDHTSETVYFIRQFNKFFDMLNVRSLYEGRNKRNPNMMPFVSVDDERLNWLSEDFIQYLDSWYNEVMHRDGNFNAKNRAGMLLSHQTLTGLKMSCKSITQCIKFMLVNGAQFVLTHAFNQDPLEQHFGHYRHKGGANRNPTVYDVRNTMTNIRTVGAQALAPKRGNTQGHYELPIIDNRKLPKRK